MSRIGAITGGVAAAESPERPSAQAVADYFETASSINDLTELIKTIQTIMSNISESTKAEMAIRGESTLGKDNPFHGMIMQEIQDLKGAGNYLLELLPYNSEDFNRVQELVKQLESIGENPTQADLDLMPNVARIFMEMSGKLPEGGEVRPGEQQLLTQSYRDRFWSKLATMFTEMSKSWEAVITSTQNNIKQLQTKRTDLQNLSDRINTKIFAPLNSGGPFTPEMISQLAKDLEFLKTLDWSLYPVGAKDSFTAALAGFKGPEIEGKQATASQLVTAHLIMTKFQEWMLQNPSAVLGYGNGTKSQKYFDLFAFIKDSLEPFRGTPLYNETLANQLLDTTVGGDKIPPDHFPVTLANIPMRGSPTGIPLAKLQQVKPPWPGLPYYTFETDSRLPNRPDVQEAFTLQQRTMPILNFTKELQALDDLITNGNSFLEFHAEISDDIMAAERAVEDARITLLPLPDQIAVQMERVTQTIRISIGNRDRLLPDDGFYPLVTTQINSLIDIGGFLIESLPPEMDKTAITTIINQLTRLRSLTTSIPPQPLPMSILEQIPTWASAFMTESKNIAPAPGWPDIEIPSGIRQTIFWRKFADMFADLSTYPGGIQQEAQDAIKQIQAQQEIATRIRPILQNLQTKVVDQLMKGEPITAVLDDLSALLLELNKHKEDIEKYPDFQKEVDTVLDALAALRGPVVDGKQTTFKDMLMSAIILRSMWAWWADDAHRNLPMYPTLPGPPLGDGFAWPQNFFRDGSGNHIPTSIIGGPGTGVIDSVRATFQNFWPNSALIDYNRVEEMLADHLPATDNSRSIPIPLVGLFVAGRPSTDGKGTYIGQFWPFNRYKVPSDPSDKFNSFPPPNGNFAYDGTWGYTYVPDLKFFESDALKQALTIPDKASLQRVTDAINGFPSDADFQKQIADQQEIIDFITNSHVIDDLKRAQAVAEEISNIALFNSSLPEALREILLNRALPAQQAVLERYGLQLYFLNSAIRIYNNIDTATSDFLAAGTNYSGSSQITTRFNHVATAPNDYYMGDADSAKAIINTQLTRTISNLNALNAQLPAIDAAITNINQDATISAENKKLLIGELQKIQVQMRQSVQDLTAMRNFLQHVQVTAENPVDGKKNFTLTYVNPPDKQLRNEEVLKRMGELENNVINGITDPRNPDQNIGGLTNINKLVTANRQNHSSMTDEAQLSLQNAMTKIQQMWTIVATMLQLLNQMYLTLARGIKGG